MGVGRLWICSSRGPSEHFTSLKLSALPTPLRWRKNDDHGQRHTPKRSGRSRLRGREGRLQVITNRALVRPACLVLLYEFNQLHQVGELI